jgi:hypothetical protein
MGAEIANETNPSPEMSVDAQNYEDKDSSSQRCRCFLVNSLLSPVA